MSLYQLHRCVYDHVRASAVGSGATAGPVDAAAYDLTDEERQAYQSRDVAALYRIGLHPVLLNGFCRSIGLSREEYRKVLEPLAQPETRTGRWHRR